jgi:hypothetical protein
MDLLSFWIGVLVGIIGTFFFLLLGMETNHD